MADRQRRVRRIAVAGGLGAIFLLGGGAPASAQQAPASCYGDGTERCAPVAGVVAPTDTGTVRSTTQAVTAAPTAGVNAAAPATRATPAAQVAGRTSQLPVTGGDVAGLAMVGGALLVGGAAIVAGSRRRQSLAL